MKRYMLIYIVALLGVLGCFLFAGCAAHVAPIPPPPPIHEFVGPGTVPTSLTGVAKALDLFILLSVLAVGLGIGLFFWLPTNHNLSLAFVFIGGGVEASSLATRVSLWAVPWIVVGFAVLAVLAAIYELIANRATVEAAAEKVLPSLSTVEAVPEEIATIAEAVYREVVAKAKAGLSEFKTIEQATVADAKVGVVRIEAETRAIGEDIAKKI
jgi:hypothetical protein